MSGTLQIALLVIAALCLFDAAVVAGLWTNARHQAHRRRRRALGSVRTHRTHAGPHATT